MNSISIMKQKYSSMSAVEKRIADCILNNPEEAVNSTVATIAKMVNVSEGSIINFASSMGFKGFSQLKINIAQNLDSHSEPDDISNEDSPQQIMHKMINSAVDSFESTFDTIGDELKQAAEILCTADTILLFGLAHSASIAQDVAFRFMRIGLPAKAFTDPLATWVACAQMTEHSVAFAISYSGRTSDIIEAARIAKKTGAKVICLTSYAESPLVDLCDVSLIAVSKEAHAYRESVISRLTQLLLCDSLCAYITLLMADSTKQKLDEMIEIYETYRNR